MRVAHCSAAGCPFRGAADVATECVVANDRASGARLPSMAVRWKNHIGVRVCMVYRCRCFVFYPRGSV